MHPVCELKIGCRELMSAGSHWQISVTLARRGSGRQLSRSRNHNCTGA